MRTGTSRPTPLLVVVCAPLCGRCWPDKSLATVAESQRMQGQRTRPVTVITSCRLPRPDHQAPDTVTRNQSQVRCDLERTCGRIGVATIFSGVAIGYSTSTELISTRRRNGSQRQGGIKHGEVIADTRPRASPKQQSCQRSRPSYRKEAAAPPMAGSVLDIQSASATRRSFRPRSAPRARCRQFVF